MKIFPEDYSYEMLKDTLAREIQGSWAKQGAYQISWKYVFHVLILKELSRSHFGKKIKKNIAEISAR